MWHVEAVKVMTAENAYCQIVLIPSWFPPVHVVLAALYTLSLSRTITLPLVLPLTCRTLTL